MFQREQAIQARNGTFLFRPPGNQARGQQPIGRTAVPRGQSGTAQTDHGVPEAATTVTPAFNDLKSAKTAAI